MASSHLTKLLESQRKRRRYRMIDLKRDRQTERETGRQRWRRREWFKIINKKKIQQNLFSKNTKDKLKYEWTKTD